MGALTLAPRGQSGFPRDPPPAPHSSVGQGALFLSLTVSSTVNDQSTWAERGEKWPPVPGGPHYLACPLLPSLPLGVFTTAFPAVALLSAHHHHPPRPLPPVFHRVISDLK